MIVNFDHGEVCRIQPFRMGERLRNYKKTKNYANNRICRTTQKKFERPHRQDEL
jgi:hypothetical protein